MRHGDIRKQLPSRYRQTSAAIRIGFAMLTMAAATAAMCQPATAGRAIAKAAAAQVGVTNQYDPSYVTLAYPGGDVPSSRGVCSDVVVRAFRSALAVDLQVAVHEDMRGSFASYPKMWGLKRPDRNIDHRRVPNLMRFFERKKKVADSRFLPGDVVAWRLPGGLYHVGVVSAAVTRGGRPLVVHNIGSGARQEDVLDAWPKIGHYRW